MPTNRGIGSRAFVPYGTAGFANANNGAVLPEPDLPPESQQVFGVQTYSNQPVNQGPQVSVYGGNNQPPPTMGPSATATGADQITPLAPRPLINRIGSSVGNGLLRSLTMGIAGRNNPNPIIGYAPNGEPVYQGRIADGHSRAADIYRNVMNSLQNYANNHANLGAPTAEGRGPGAGGGTGGWGFGSQNNPGGFGNFGFAAGGGGAITHFLMNAPLRKH